MPKERRAPPLLKSLGRKFQGAGGRCGRVFQGLQWEPCSQGHGPDVLVSPLQPPGARCCSPPPCLGRAPGAPLKTHLETPSDSCRRRRLPTAGAGGGCKGLSFSPLGRLPPLAIGCDKAELKNDAAGQTEVKLAYDHTPHSDEERSPSSLSETARTPWPFSQQVGSVQIQSVLLIIRESTFVLFQKVQFQGHFFFFSLEKRD